MKNKDDVVRIFKFFSILLLAQLILGIIILIHINISIHKINNINNINNVDNINHIDNIKNVMKENKCEGLFLNDDVLRCGRNICKSDGFCKWESILIK